MHAIGVADALDRCLRAPTSMPIHSPSCRADIAARRAPSRRPRAHHQRRRSASNPHSARCTASAQLPATSCLGASRTPAVARVEGPSCRRPRNLHKKRHHIAHRLNRVQADRHWIGGGGGQGELRCVWRLRDSRKSNRYGDFDKSFWDDVNCIKAGLPEACGCYVFALQNGHNIKAWYVGKAEKQSFRKECFFARKKSGSSMKYLSN